MKPIWRFVKVHPGDKIREPIQGEFFSTDAIRNPAEALVRESIQNSLDASHDGKTVLVRIYFSGENDALSAEKASRYFEGAWDHFRSERTGLVDVPNISDPCRFFAFEDFGTTGLQGDPQQWEKPEIKENNDFFYFFRADGLSNKGEQDRGRWGVGKTVFPRSSRINTFFGVTIRSDDRRTLLMGQTLLKHHKINGILYGPDGTFGEAPNDGLILPIEDEIFVKHFCQDFDLQRGSEPGLSIVVPFYISELSEKAVIEEVLRSYFFPILTGKLEVIIESPNIKTILDSKTVIQETLEIGGALSKELIPLLELAQWGIDRTSEEFFQLNIPPATGPLRWMPELIPADLSTKIKGELEKGQFIAVHIPLIVREKGKNEILSHFNLFFTRGGREESGKTIFVREGVIIPDVRSPRMRGVRSLVIIEDKPLATLLGDSENPAHTQWQKDGSNFKGKYVNGPSYLTFVINSVAQIFQILSGREREKDPTLLIDFFSLPASSTQNGFRTLEEKTANKPGRETSPPPSTLPRPPRRFKIETIPGGFKIKSGEAEAPPPKYLEIQAAYDIRRGNPLKKYNKEDFQMDKLPIRLEPEPRNIKIIERLNNRIIAEVLDVDFRITITGFDEHRDVYVKVLAKEELNDSQG